MKDPIRKFIREQIKSLAEAKVDYDFSEKELVRVLKQLKRGASTEVDMIKAFEKALGRQITDKELFGETTAENTDEPSDAEYDQMAKDAEQDDLLRKAAELGYIDLEEAAKDLGYLNEESIEDQAKIYWMKLVKQGKIDKLPSNPTDAFLNQMTKDAIWKDREKEKFEKPQYSELDEAGPFKGGNYLPGAEDIDFDVKSINMVYTDFGRFYGFNMYSEPGLKGQREKFSFRKDVDDFLQSKGIQTEIPVGYDEDILDSIVADLRKQGIEAEHHDYMDVSEGNLNETYTVGKKVTYLGHPAVITAVKEYNGKTYYSVSYDKGSGKTKASDVLSTDGTIKPLEESKSKEDQLNTAWAAFKKAEMDGDIRGQELALAMMDLIQNEPIKKGVRSPESEKFRKKVKDYLAKKDKNLKEMASELGYMNEESTETGLMVIPRTSQDANKIYAYLDDSNWTADWNSAEGYFLFPEEEDLYDSLEAEIEEFLVDIGANARIEGIF